MGFMNSYKRLDNLCRDMNGIGVTGYIEDMERAANSAYHIPGWNRDYLQLKHYRHIRNRIAHDNNCEENDLCTAEDAEWVEYFYQRILTQDDPLALFFKYKRSYVNSKPPESQPTQTTLHAPGHPARRPVGCASVCLFMLAIAVFILFILFS